VTSERLESRGATRENIPIVILNILFCTNRPRALSLFHPRSSVSVSMPRISLTSRTAPQQRPQRTKLTRLGMVCGVWCMVYGVCMESPKHYSTSTAGMAPSPRLVWITARGSLGLLGTSGGTGLYSRVAVAMPEAVAILLMPADSWRRPSPTSDVACTYCSRCKEVPSTSRRQGPGPGPIKKAHRAFTTMAVSPALSSGVGLWSRALQSSLRSESGAEDRTLPPPSLELDTTEHPLSSS
jgi:hypothetical protein